jgi:hypothetical protein
VSGIENDRKATDHGFWVAMDEWEPEPISLDFNRRLYDRVRTIESQKSLRAVPHLSAIILFVLLMLFTSSTRQTPDGNGDALSDESGAASVVPEPEHNSMAQVLADLNMLQTLNSAEPL